MQHRPSPRFPIAVALTTASILAGCKRTGSETRPPAPPEASVSKTRAAPAIPPQDPDPPELLAARADLLRGDTEAVAATLTDSLPTWTGDGRIRARAIGHALLALGMAENVVEEAEPHAAAALEEADKLADPEATVWAKTAAGVVALGMEDFDAAVAHLEAAAAVDEAPPEVAALSATYAGQAYIGRAYGPGGGSKLLYPEDLERAKAAYERALERTAAGPDSGLITGRAHEGLAAVAKYQGNSVDVCTHAEAASEAFATTEATDRLREGPRMLREAARCK